MRGAPMLLLLVLLLAAAPAWAGAEDPPSGIHLPNVGLVLPDRSDNIIYAYFPSRPEALPDRLEIALVERGREGRIVSAEHCCLLRRSNNVVSFHDLDGYAHDLWRLQLLWPGEPPREVMEGLGFVVPGRDPEVLAEGRIGIDLERDGVTENFMVCRDDHDLHVTVLGEPNVKPEHQPWRVILLEWAAAPLSGCQIWPTYLVEEVVIERGPPRPARSASSPSSEQSQE
jgi:hypothetical protein